MLNHSENDVLTLFSWKTDSKEISALFPYWSGISDISGMVWHTSFNILISVYYVNWHFVIDLEIALFEFVSLDAKALRSIALFFVLYQLWTDLYKVFCLNLLTLASGITCSYHYLIHLTNISVWELWSERTRCLEKCSNLDK